MNKDKENEFNALFRSIEPASVARGRGSLLVSNPAIKRLGTRLGGAATLTNRAGTQLGWLIPVLMKRISMVPHTCVWGILICSDLDWVRLSSCPPGPQVPCFVRSPARAEYQLHA